MARTGPKRDWKPNDIQFQPTCHYLHMDAVFGIETSHLGYIDAPLVPA